MTVTARASANRTGNHEPPALYPLIRLREVRGGDGLIGVPLAGVLKKA